MGEDDLGVASYSASVARADVFDAMDTARLEDKESRQQHEQKQRDAAARARKHAQRAAARANSDRQRRQRHADPQIAAETHTRRTATKVRQDQARARNKRRLRAPFICDRERCRYTASSIGAFSCIVNERR